MSSFSQFWSSFHHKAARGDLYCCCRIWTTSDEEEIDHHTHPVTTVKIHRPAVVIPESSLIDRCTTMKVVIISCEPHPVVSPAWPVVIQKVSAITKTVRGHVESVEQRGWVDPEVIVLCGIPLPVGNIFKLDSQSARDSLIGELVDLFQTHPVVSVVNFKPVLVVDPWTIETDISVDPLLEHDPVVHGKHRSWCTEGWYGQISRYVLCNILWKYFHRAGELTQNVLEYIIYT